MWTSTGQKARQLNHRAGEKSREMNFTEQQRVLIKDSLEKMNLEELGVEYFKTLFELDPSLMEKFPCLKEESAASLSSPLDHPDMKCHGATFFKMIREGAINLCDTGKLKHDTISLQRMDEAHQKNKVVESDFPVYEDTFGRCVLNKRFTKDYGFYLTLALLRNTFDDLLIGSFDRYEALVNDTIRELEAAEKNVAHP